MRRRRGRPYRRSAMTLEREPPAAPRTDAMFPTLTPAQRERLAARE